VPNHVTGAAKGIEVQVCKQVRIFQDEMQWWFFTAPVIDAGGRLTSAPTYAFVAFAERVLFPRLFASHKRQNRHKIHVIILFQMPDIALKQV